MEFLRTSCMTILLLSIIFVLAPSSAMDTPIESSGGHRSNAELGFMFQTWMSKHGKRYINAVGEKEQRFQIFKDNLHFIDQHNAKNLSYQLGLNRFADLTVEEYRDLFLDNLNRKQGLIKPVIGTWHLRRISYQSLLTGGNKVQFRRLKIKANAVSSCWAFSSVAAIEGINKIATGELISLSEQELIDCNMENRGCNNGYMDIAFEYLSRNNIGLYSEFDYPYTAFQGYCNRIQDGSKKVVTIDGYEDVPVNDENSLKKAVAHQPVSVGVDKKAREFQLYTSGIYNGPCGTDLDHALVIVGYGSENGQDYWIARNSWGTVWGEAGYVRMARNFEIPSGLCGIAMVASYPIKNSASNA